MRSTLEAAASSVGDQNGPNASAPTLLLNGNSVSVVSLSTANYLAGLTPVIQNSNAAAATLTIGGSATKTFNGTIQDGAGVGALSLTKSGSGTQVLSRASTYSGGTIVSGGVLLASNSTGSATGSGVVTVASGGTLGGPGAIGGMVTNQSGGAIAPGAGVSAAGTVLTINSNLTLSAGSLVYFNLGTLASGPNDQIVANGAMTLDGAVFHIKAPSTSVNLDFADYVLITNSSVITVVGSASLVWDVAPLNAAKYSILPAGNTILLHYAASPGPVILSSSAIPNPAYPNQTVLISAGVTTNGSTLNSITVDASQAAGMAPGTTILTLVSSGNANPTTYTNSVTVGALVPIGTVTNYFTAIDNASITALATNTLTIISGVPKISAFSASPNPVGPGQVIAITATVVGYSYPISSVTVTGARSPARP